MTSWRGWVGALAAAVERGAQRVRRSVEGPAAPPAAEGPGPAPRPELPATAARAAPEVPLQRAKPGWMARVWGTEVATLVAVDAAWDGRDWVAVGAGARLYRTAGGAFFLEGVGGKVAPLDPDSARRAYACLARAVGAAP
jgi:hypothetical protein